VSAGAEREADRLRALLEARERELARAREELRRLTARAGAAELTSERKTRFIGNVSHEFRTPLSSIIGFVALLSQSDAELPHNVRDEYLEIIQRNARHLLHVVNDLLNISKVEAGTLEVSAAPLRPRDVAEAVIAALAPQIAERRLRVHLVDDARRPAVADAGRLRQVLFNLLENAIKYSPEGEEIVVRTLDHGTWVRVAVIDRGPGIHESAQPRLFKEFSRVNPPGSRVVGAGLGLALSRMLTEAMGGRVDVDTAPGRGSTFWLDLPAADGAVVPVDATLSPVPSRAAARGSGECVAVVDDDPDIRAYAVAALSRSGYRSVADDGSPGVAARLAVVRPQAVLMDLNLGDRSGEEALEELRREPVLARVPVAAFTAAAGWGAGGRPAPFADRLLKPATPEDLAACVAGLLAGASSAEAGAAQKETGGPAATGAQDDEESDEAFMAPLRARFRAGLFARLAELRAGGAAGDWPGLVRIIHRLRGAAGGYGFAEVEARAAEAEEALRDGAPDAYEAVRRLEAVLQEEIDGG
jgi:nitrogen-specific signal transduction histidine kinase/CheY-like chemotaxis protein